MSELVLNPPYWKNRVSSDRDVEEETPFRTRRRAPARVSSDREVDEKTLVQDIPVSMQEVVQASEMEWINNTLQKLGNLSQFPANWDSYGGLPLDPFVRDKAVTYLGWLEKEDLPTPDVFLGSGGTVQFEWQIRGKALELEIKKPGTIAWLKVFPNEEMEEGEIARPNAGDLSQLTHWLTRG